MIVLDGYPDARCIRVARRVRLEMVQSVPADHRTSAREITPRIDRTGVKRHGNDVVNIVQLDQVVVPCKACSLNFSYDCPEPVLFLN